MIKKLTFTIVCLGLVWGCATAPPQRAFKGNTFISDFPKLKVKIHENYKWDQGRKSSRNRKMQHDSWWWHVANKEGVGILFTTYHKSTSFDYYYSLENIARNWHRIPLGSLNINGHNWIKYAYINGEIVKYKPEYEDCMRIARENNIPIHEVYREVEQLTGKKDDES